MPLRLSKMDQTIVGGGALDIKTPTGRSVTVTIPDASISGEGDNGSGGPNRFFEMADNSSLIGVTASINRAGSTVIAHIDGKQNVTIRDNKLTSTVSASTASAFLIKNSHDITIDNNDVSIVANGSTGQFIAFTDNNSNVSVNNNTVSMTGSILTADQHYILLAGGVTINNLSGTGNTSNIDRCYIVSTYTITGTITTNGTTCP